MTTNNPVVQEQIDFIVQKVLTWYKETFIGFDNVSSIGHKLNLHIKPHVDYLARKHQISLTVLTGDLGNGSKLPDKIWIEVKREDNSVALCLREEKPKLAVARAVPIHIPDLAFDEVLKDFASGVPSQSDYMLGKLNFIVKEVMDELKFTSNKQLLPLGVKNHLERLAGHRFNYPENYPKDIENFTVEELKKKLYWFNLLATFNTVIEFLEGRHEGYIETTEPVIN